jgi:hypothetical protein
MKLMAEKVLFFMGIAIMATLAHKLQEEESP